MFYLLSEAWEDMVVDMVTEGQAFGIELVLSAGNLPTVQAVNLGTTDHTDAGVFYDPGTPDNSQ